MALKALELFCGIGGFAAAVAGWNVRVVEAIDQSRDALSVYRLNFPGHGARQADLEKVTADELAAHRADIWWLSPPCQPYSVRGARKDVDDPRARSLVRIMEVLPRIPKDRLPLYLALENVEGFAQSEARCHFTSLLSQRGYRIQERRLCPTELGVPSRRPRYFLTASRAKLNPCTPPVPTPVRHLSEYINPMLPGNVPGPLLMPDDTVARFGAGLRILDAAARHSYTTCFTSGYGKSIMHAGSYLRCGEGVRRFAPEEIARLLHFPSWFRFPENMPCRKKWRLVGNSLSVIAVREILRAFPHILP